MEYVSFILVSIIIFLIIYRRHDTSLNRATIKHTTKERRKLFVVEYLKYHPKTNNHEMREFLHVSDPTMTRYFEELESEGEIKKIGEYGRGVYYVLNK